MSDEGVGEGPRGESRVSGERLEGFPSYISVAGEERLMNG